MNAISNDVIMDDIKKILQLPTDYDVFDLDMKIGIDSAFSTLQQLGVGPEEAFTVEDGNETWSQFFQDVPEQKNLKAVKTYIQLRVRVLFDPPTNSFGLESLKEQIKELEWRLSVQAEGIKNVTR